MSNDTKLLDTSVDYIKQAAIVILASLTAYSTVSSANEEFLPWVVLVYGFVIAYALFLPYKRATIVSDEWAQVSRVKSLGLIFLGIPMYVVPAIVVWFYEDIASFLPTFQVLISTSNLYDAVNLLFQTTMLLLIVSLIGAVIMNKVFHYLLRSCNYKQAEIEEIARYKVGRSGMISMGFSLIIIYALMYLLAGWENPSISNDYFFSSLVMIFLLVIFGFVSPILTPQAKRSGQFRLFEFLFLFSVVLTTISTQLMVLFCVTASLSLFQLYRLSIKVRSNTNPDSLAAQRKETEYQNVIEQNFKKMEQDQISYIYYKLHPTVNNILSVLTLCWWGLIFVYLIEIGLLNSFILFLIPGIIFMVVPYMWLIWNEFRKNMDEVALDIRKEGLGGNLRFWEIEPEDIEN
ncbi:MAG: hypothetical protein ACTSWA_13610 [Candidatus Thorarchaeota archaeon]